MCESPKHIYFPSGFTFGMLKQHIILSFKFLHGKPDSQLRMWKLAGNFPEFMHYYRTQLSINVIAE